MKIVQELVLPKITHSGNIFSDKCNTFNPIFEHVNYCLIKLKYVDNSLYLRRTQCPDLKQHSNNTL